MTAPELSFPGLVVAHLIPWLMGGALAYALLKPRGKWNGFIIAGHGYLLGVLITTVLMKASGLLGFAVQFWPLLALQLLLAMAIMAWSIMRQTESQIVRAPTVMAAWQVGVVVCLLLLIAARYYLIANELLLRPLFPWDAWMNWAPEPVTWFFHGGELVPFVSPKEWLEAGGKSLVYTHGAGLAWKNPDTVPLIQLWAMIGLGTSDHPLIYLSWLFVVIALGSALYGHLRLSGLGIPSAMLASYALLSLPLVNVHVALAGYADIWVAAAFGGAVMALYAWQEQGELGYAIIGLLLAVLCTLLKVPGLVLGGILLVLLGIYALRLGRTPIMWTLGLTGLVVIYALLVGIDIPLGNLGRITLSNREIVLPYLGRSELAYHSIHREMALTLFTMWNWNLLWYVFFTAGPLLLCLRRTGLIPSLDLMALYLALLFMFVTYFFTYRYQFVQDFTQINRALMYTVPVIVFSLAIRIYRGFFAREPV